MTTALADAPIATRPVATWRNGGRAAARVLEWEGPAPRVGFVWAAAGADPNHATDPRLVTFRVLLDDLAARLLHQVAREVAGDPVLALLAVR